MNFRATLLLGGKTATGIRVPDEVVAALGSSKRPAVTVTINGYSYRSTIAPMGGAFMLPVSAEIRAGAGVAAGDEVDVTLEPDNAPREVVIPADFSAALSADPGAERFFETLSYSNKRRFTLSIEDARTAETRARRIARAVSTLHEGKM